MFTIFILQVERVAIYYWFFKSQVLHTSRPHIYINFPFAGSSSPPLLAFTPRSELGFQQDQSLSQFLLLALGPLSFSFPPHSPCTPISAASIHIEWNSISFIKLTPLHCLSLLGLHHPLFVPSPQKKSNWEYRSMIECLPNIHKALCSVPSTRHLPAPPKKNQKINMFYSLIVPCVSHTCMDCLLL